MSFIPCHWLPLLSIVFSLSFHWFVLFTFGVSWFELLSYCCSLLHIVFSLTFTPFHLLSLFFHCVSYRLSLLFIAFTMDFYCFPLFFIDYHCSSLFLTLISIAFQCCALSAIAFITSWLTLWMVAVLRLIVLLVNAHWFLFDYRRAALVFPWVRISFHSNVIDFSMTFIASRCSLFDFECLSMVSHGFTLLSFIPV